METAMLGGWEAQMPPQVGASGVVVGADEKERRRKDEWLCAQRLKHGVPHTYKKVSEKRICCVRECGGVQALSRERRRWPKREKGLPQSLPA